MTILTVTARGQVTFHEDILQHLGIEPGGRLLVEKLPDGGVSLRATKLTGTIEDVFGCLAGKTDKVATLEEIKDAIEAGWAGEVTFE